MDESLQYVKMCQKAKEIQKLKALRQGDWMSWKGTMNVIIIGGRTLDVAGFQDYIWLPRQDQLQAMLGDFEQQLDILDDWRERGKEPMPYWNIGNLKSWEQLCLAFVMEQKNNKVWNGEDWINAL